MAYLPLNIFLAVLFVFGIVWGWEGEELRQLFAVFSATFLLPLWTASLYSIVESSGTMTIAVTPKWLPTVLLVNLLWWTVTLMYFTGAHLMQTLGREDPLAKAFKRARKR